MKTFIERLEVRGLRLGSPIKREAGQIFRPLRQSSFCFGDAQVILGGEASGLISPITAEGFSSAFISAVSIAEAFQKQGFDPALYRRLLRHWLWRFWRNRYKIPLMFNPVLRKYVLLSGLRVLRR
jgi:flavin-dependent dehydrogenase